jgi:metal-sulfur cluster biosynthetic enzyme
MAVSDLQVQTALKELVDPNTQKDFVSTKSVRNIKIDGGTVSVDILLGYPAQSQLATIKQQVEDKLKSIDGVTGATANVSFKIVSHSVQRASSCFPTSRTSSLSLPARAASANRPPPSTWHWRCLPKARESACWTPISMVRRNPPCSASPTSLSRLTARTSNH